MIGAEAAPSDARHNPVREEAPISARVVCLELACQGTTFENTAKCELRRNESASQKSVPKRLTVAPLCRTPLDRVPL
jgi:hypothetical protein